MRALLLTAACLMAASPALADEEALWSVGQSVVSPEYVLCKANADCLQRTTKVVDLELPVRVAGGIPAEIKPVRPVLFTIQFRLASARLSEKAKGDIAHLIKQGSANQYFAVTGTTDKLRSSRFNRRLALARARAVQGFLIQQGVPAARISISSSCCVDYPPLDNPPARKAVIRLTDPEIIR